MSAQMRQFYMNGGGTAWVTRLANGYANADVVLRNEAGADVLRVTAVSAGIARKSFMGFYALPMAAPSRSRCSRETPVIPKP
jgi:hypothetical protein